MEVRRRRTLAEQLASSSSSPSPNLRDLLKLQEIQDRRSPPSFRTLLDIINDGGEESRPLEARTSLMALLEEADSQPAPPSSSLQVQGEAIVKEIAAEEDREEEIEASRLCCVCMARGKGAAFIPCGHTFCRICSRELWTGRRHCPLCNVTIQQVLDIF